MRLKGFLTMSAVLLTTVAITHADCPGSHPAAEAYNGWRLGVQTWSFNRFTLFEAIDKTRSLGLNWIQAYPGQRISADINAQFGPDLNAEQRQAIKTKLKDAQIGIFAFGVTGIPREEAAARKLYEFARDMGIPTLVSEPEFNQFDMIDKLCQEYGIKLAVHNHPKPTRYWDPKTMLQVFEGRSNWIGACADVGHWVRSGLDPVECLKMLEGRLIDIHTKEIDNGHDVVWGTGQGRIKAVLEELHRQGYKGTFSVEYEYNWDNNVPEIRQSTAYFNRVAAELNPTGWKPLFADDLSNADFNENAWTLQEGELRLTGGGDIWTRDEYSDFVLDFEFKVEKNTNSGVFLRARDHEWLPWVEVQISDTFGRPVSRHVCGAIFDIKEPAVNAVKPAGEWNRMTILAKGSLVCVQLNNEQIIAIDLNDWTQAKKNPDGTANKFDIAYKDLPRTGFLGFQDHRDGTKVWYRNIKIKEL